MARDCIGNLRQRDDAADTACVTDPTCANVRGLGSVRERSFADDQAILARVQLPACWVHPARLARAVRVLGCSAPDTRSMTGTSVANWSRAADRKSTRLNSSH